MKLIRLAMEINKLKQVLDKKTGERDLIKKQIKDNIASLSVLKSNLEILNEVDTIIKTVANKTQEIIRYKITDIVTKALQVVFGNDYEFIMEMDNKRGKNNIYFYIKKGDMLVDVLDSSGGGVADVVSFALRLSLFILNRKQRSVFIFDEPFKFLSVDLQEKMAQFLQDIAKELGIQIILTTHSKIFERTANNLISLK